MINKLIHFYKYGESLCKLARKYNTTSYKILKDSNINSIEMLTDFTPLIIEIKSSCSEKESLYCNEEKRGCNGCYYFK